MGRRRRVKLQGSLTGRPQTPFAKMGNGKVMCKTHTTADVPPTQPDIPPTPGCYTLQFQWSFPTTSARGGRATHPPEPNEAVSFWRHFCFERNGLITTSSEFARRGCTLKGTCSHLLIKSSSIPRPSQRTRARSRRVSPQAPRRAFGQA